MKVPSPDDTVVVKMEDETSDSEDDRQVNEVAMEHDSETDLPSSQNKKDSENSEDGSSEFKSQKILNLRYFIYRSAFINAMMLLIGC